MIRYTENHDDNRLWDARFGTWYVQPLVSLYTYSSSVAVAIPTELCL